MMPITILTATYNHPTELEKLYHSLLDQTDINFSWVIVDDGSEEETRKVIDNFKQEGKIEITAIHQENGGKSKAINRGIDLLKTGTEFFVIIDDDEKLIPEAITIIKGYYYKYRNEGCGVIHFNRKDENGKVIARPYFENDFFMSYQEHKSKGYHADGYLGYFTQKLGNNRFDIFEGEKYIGPSTLVMKVSGDKNSKLLWASATIGHTEYLEGGITKQGRRLRIKNPQGMIEYCTLMQENGASLKNKLVYSINGYAYLRFLKNKDFDRKKLNKLVSVCRIPGEILAQKWKKQFLK